MKGYVYVLRPQMLLDGEEVVKIGMTTRTVERRVKELSTGSPVPFEIVHTILADDAKELERSLHWKFRDRRIRVGGGTEYFAVAATEVVEAIKDIETEASSEQARKAFQTELSFFKNSIGKPKFERNIGYIMYPVWAGVIYALFQQWSYLGGFLGFFVGGTANAYFLSKLSDKRFGKRIDEKSEELRLRYPNAY
jgi:hypothetical protein